MIASLNVPQTRGIRLAAGAVLAAAIAFPFSPVHPSVCPLQSTTGIPCPFCGMTRVVSAAVHGNLVESLRFNPVGILVALAAVLIVVRPAFVTRLPRPPLWTLWAVLGVMWVWNVGFNPTFHQWLLPG